MILAVTLVAVACSSDGDEPAPVAAGDQAPAGSGATLDIGPGRTDLVVELADDTSISVTILAPVDWTPGMPTPVLLALPPGDQNQSMVDAGISRYWESGPERGWVVVSPASSGENFIRGGARQLAPLLDALAGTVVAESGRVHVAGPSNGGLSAFRFALDHPDTVRSVVGLPGYPPGADESIEPLVDIPVALYVGETDVGWRAPMERFAADLADLGGSVDITVSAGEGHVLENINPDELFDVLDAAR